MSDCFMQEYVFRCARAPLAELDFGIAQLLAYGDSIRDADQVRILKLDAGTLIAIVEQCVDTSLDAFGVK